MALPVSSLASRPSECRTAGGGGGCLGNIVLLSKLCVCSKDAQMTVCQCYRHY